MHFVPSVALIIAGAALVVHSAEKLVPGVVGIARGFGPCAFFVSGVFIGFDPEHLGVGAVGSYGGPSSGAPVGFATRAGGDGRPRSEAGR
ncbi:MAG TPA: hypothetical protein VF158_01770 [Longimicrobiales bacterium]